MYQVSDSCKSDKYDAHYLPHSIVPIIESPNVSLASIKKFYNLPCASTISLAPDQYVLMISTRDEKGDKTSETGKNF